jgi:hypothetical protein
VTDPTAAFAKMVPGFDFLQGLVKGAGAALPSVGQWVAPTLDPEELDKRIKDLKTVQFWLEQNARMLGATIQALEVQRMTLSTLKTMNVSLGDLTESLKIRMPEAAAPAEPEAAAPAPSFWQMPSAAPAPAARKAAPPPPAPEPEPEPEEPAASAQPQVPPGVVDPMQWWGALTQQFTELATNAMKGDATDAAKTMAGAMVKQSLDAATETFKKAADLPAAAAKTAADAARKMAGGATATKAAPGKAKAPAAPARKRSTAAAKPATKAAAKRR